MKVTDWIRRVGCVLSAAWLAAVQFGVPEWRRAEQVLEYGVLPLVVAWALAWAIARSRTPRVRGPARANPNASRWHFATVIVVAVGLVGAFLAVDAARLNYQSDGVVRTVFHWAVIGAIAGFAAGAICRGASGVPLLVAAVVAVAGVDWKYGSDVWESHLMTVSYARSTPILNRIERGAVVTTQEVKDAHVGILEPLVLAQTDYRSEVDAAGTAYKAVMTNLNIREAMSPRTLSTASGLAAARDTLGTWGTSLDALARLTDAIAARDRATVKAALDTVPAQVRNRAGASLSSSVAMRNESTKRLIEHERACLAAFVGIVDLLSANPRKYAYVAGGPNQLQFSDANVLERYNAYVRAAQEAARWETETTAQQTRESEALIKRRNQAIER